MKTTEHYPATENRTTKRRSLAVAGATALALLTTACEGEAKDLSAIDNASNDPIPAKVERVRSAVFPLILDGLAPKESIDSSVERVVLPNGKSVLVGSGHGIRGDAEVKWDCNKVTASIGTTSGYIPLEKGSTKYDSSQRAEDGNDFAVLTPKEEQITRYMGGIPLAAEKPEVGDIVYQVGYVNGRTAINPAEYLGKTESAIIFAQPARRGAVHGHSGGAMVNSNGEQFGVVSEGSYHALTIDQINSYYDLDIETTPNTVGDKFNVTLAQSISANTLQTLGSLDTCDF